MPGLPYAITCEITFDGVSVGSPTWVDITDRLLGFTTFRGQQKDTDGPQPGTLTVRLDNTDGAFDPDNDASPYYGGLLPNRRVRLTAQLTSGSSPVGLGYAYLDRLERSWPGGLVYSESVLSCTDLTKLYNGWTISGLVMASGYYAENHMNAVASYAASVGGAGLAFVGASYNGAQWEYITQVATSDGGFFFIGTDGNPVYHTSSYRTSETVSTTPQAVFAFGTPNGIAVETDLVPYMDDSLLANTISVIAADGVPHPSTHPTSVSQFGAVPFELDTQMSGGGGLTGGAANTRAARLRDERSFPTTRIDSFTLDALTDDDSLEQALTREISDRITLLIGPVGGGSAMTQDYWINSIAHDVTLDGTPQWRTTYEVVAITGTLATYSAPGTLLRTTATITANLHDDNLTIRAMFPDTTTFDLPGVNTGATGVEHELGDWDFDAVVWRMINNSYSFTVTEPDWHITKTATSGTGWTGFTMAFEDGGDSDYNDVILQVRYYT